MLARYFRLHGFAADVRLLLGAYPKWALQSSHHPDCCSSVVFTSSRLVSNSPNGFSVWVSYSQFRPIADLMLINFHLQLGRPMIWWHGFRVFISLFSICFFPFPRASLSPCFEYLFHMCSSFSIVLWSTIKTIYQSPQLFYKSSRYVSFFRSILLIYSLRFLISVVVDGLLWSLNDNKSSLSFIKLF